MGTDRIVAIGFLTQANLMVLGTGFDRLYPVKDDGQFDDLLKQLEKVQAIPAPCKN